MNTILTSKNKINALVQLGLKLRNPDAELTNLIDSAKHFNAWFTPESTGKAIESIAAMLNEKDLQKWLSDSIDIEPEKANRIQSVGLVLAGNIPLVGFHDILCVLATGKKALIKLSSQDQKLIPYILNQLISIEPAIADQVEYIDRLKNFDAVIATGSNNTARYFEYYFKHVPHIIRKNRNSAAVIQGTENADQLAELGNDIFDYFGLGCRNVSKLYVPKNYNFNYFFESIEKFKGIADHHKYINNYDYNKSIYLVNQDKHLDNGFLLLKEDTRLASPLAVLYYEEYDNLNDLKSNLNIIAGQIQCLVCSENLDLGSNQVNFGQSQQPKLWDYADSINTLEFLKDLPN
ncbi:acyl-CoA reductase [Daejeonella oryzae]|uniref:acyl-CoA reductase n=1 Tax=Daejeonella oryzae TaxID=1122943 RepID=UPI0003F9266D|nr:acyl-CoA reductase [Daejeonella oryzae]